MKYLLMIIVSLGTLCAPLYAGDLEKDVDGIVRGMFTDDHLDLVLPMIAAQAMDSGGKTIDADLLVIKAKEAMRGHDFSKQFYPFFEKSFTPKEVKKLRHIYEEEAFIKMQQHSVEFSQLFMLALNQLMQDIIDEHGQPAIINKPADEDSRVMSITTESFKNEVELYKGMVVVDVYADWCGPCKKMKPIFDELSNEYTHIKFVKINNDESKELLKQYNVTALPTFLFIKNGTMVGRHTGYLNADGMKAKIKEIFN